MHKIWDKLIHWFSFISFYHSHTEPGSLKIYVYEGVKSSSTSNASVVDISEFIGADIVLTTYDVLREDLTHDFDRHEGYDLMRRKRWCITLVLMFIVLQFTFILKQNGLCDLLRGHLRNIQWKLLVLSEEYVGSLDQTQDPCLTALLLCIYILKPLFVCVHSFCYPMYDILLMLNLCLSFSSHPLPSIFEVVLDFSSMSCCEFECTYFDGI